MSLYGFGERCLNIRYVCKGLKSCFKVHNLCLPYKHLGQMITLNQIFYVAMSAYRFIKLRNSPQFPVKFRKGRFLKKIFVQVRLLNTNLLNTKKSIYLKYSIF